MKLLDISRQVLLTSLSWSQKWPLKPFAVFEGETLQGPDLTSEHDP
jgi:hypothetical protein